MQEALEVQEAGGGEEGVKERVVIKEEAPEAGGVGAEDRKEDPSADVKEREPSEERGAGRVLEEPGSNEVWRMGPDVSMGLEVGGLEWGKGAAAGTKEENEEREEKEANEVDGDAPGLRPSI